MVLLNCLISNVLLRITISYQSFTFLLIVGKEGHIYTFDDNEKHQERAKENIESWITSWNKTKLSKWPENITFYNMSVKECLNLMNVGIDTVS